MKTVFMFLLLLLSSGSYAQGMPIIPVKPGATMPYTMPPAGATMPYTMPPAGATMPMSAPTPNNPSAQAILHPKLPSGVMPIYSPPMIVPQPLIIDMTPRVPVIN